MEGGEIVGAGLQEGEGDGVVAGAEVDDPEDVCRMRGHSWIADH